MDGGQAGYSPNSQKKAMIGYYLGNLGEMQISTNPGFRLVDATITMVIIVFPFGSSTLQASTLAVSNLNDCGPGELLITNDLTIAGPGANRLCR